MASPTGPGQQRERSGFALLASLSLAIVYMDLPPYELDQVEEALIRACLLCLQLFLSGFMASSSLSMNDAGALGSLGRFSQ